MYIDYKSHVVFTRHNENTDTFLESTLNIQTSSDVEESLSSESSSLESESLPGIYSNKGKCYAISSGAI